MKALRPVVCLLMVVSSALAGDVTVHALITKRHGRMAALPFRFAKFHRVAIHPVDLC